MPGRTPQEAVRAFLTPLEDTIACVAKAKILLSKDGQAKTGKIHGLTLNGDRAVELKGPAHLLLKVRMQYEIVPTTSGQDGKWRVSTRAYAHSLETRNGQVVISYHWHPDPSTKFNQPHIHLGHTQLAPDAVLRNKFHIPTSRMSLEAILRSAITEFGVDPVRDDWDKILTEREAAFLKYRSWEGTPEEADT